MNIPKKRSIALGLFLSFIPFGIFYSGFTPGLIVIILDILVMFIVGALTADSNAETTWPFLLLLAVPVIHIAFPIVYIRKHNASVETILQGFARGT